MSPTVQPCAPCGCPWWECDACGAVVPRGETEYVPYGPGNLGGDGRFCAACRGADPADEHEVCPECGRCVQCTEACPLSPANEKTLPESGLYCTRCGVSADDRCSCVGAGKEKRP